MSWFNKKYKFSMLLKGVLDPIKQWLLEYGKGTGTSGVKAYHNVWNVYAIIDHISSLTSDLPIRQYEMKGGQKTEVLESEEHRMFFYRPNKLNTGSDMMKTMVMYYMLNGNTYLWPIGSVDRPLEVWPLLSQNVEIIEGNSLENPIARYEYSEFNRPMIFQPEEILHIKTTNPSSRTTGMSVIEAAQGILESQISGQAWNKSIMDNDGAAPGAWVVESSMDVKQLKEMQQIIRESNKDVQKGEPLVYGGGMKYEKYSLSPRDMEWVTTDKMAMRKVCAVTHYPPELLGDGENKTYSNMESAYKHLHLNTVIPIGRVMLDGINHFFFPDGKTWFEISEKDIAAIQESTTEMVNSLVNAYWLTMNQKLKKMGLPETDDPIGEKYLIPVNYQLSDDMLIGDPGEGEGV